MAVTPGPNTPHPSYTAIESLWLVCRDAYDGETAIKASGERYVAKSSRMTDVEFQAYLNYPTWYAAFARTIDGLTGAAFRVPPTVTVPTSSHVLVEDVTLTGVTLFDVARDVLNAWLTVGRAGVLVDYTTSEAPVQRAYLRVLRAEQILSWRTDNRGGVETLTRVVLAGFDERTTGEWEINQVKVLTVLDLGDGTGQPAYRMRRFEGQKNAEGSTQWVQVGADIIPLLAGQPLTFIPFVFVSTSITPTKPPLLDLANLNIGHFRVHADFLYGAMKTSRPVVWIGWCGPRHEPAVRSRSSVESPAPRDGEHSRIPRLRALNAHRRVGPLGAADGVTRRTRAGLADATSGNRRDDAHQGGSRCDGDRHRRDGPRRGPHRCPHDRGGVDGGDRDGRGIYARA